jgi:hypothetical protein
MNDEENKLPAVGDGEHVPQFLADDHWYGVDVSQDMLDFDKPYQPPRYTMERNGIPFADVGELHIVSGKPGNGKTGLMAQLEAATLSGRFCNLQGREVAHKIRDYKTGEIVDERVIPTRLLHIDTEQGEDDTIAFKNRVCSMASIASSKAKENFFILRLRDTETAAERWQKILSAIWKVKPTDIFLDGMLDIVEDYNDQKECQPIIRKCMMMATFYDASLWAVLHENPLVDKLVGTLGSITQRKVSEIFTVIKVKQSDLKENDRNPALPDIYFRVKQVKARGRDVEDWFFRYENNVGGWGQPVELEATGTVVVDNKRVAKLKEYDELLKAYNWTSSGTTYTELERHIRNQGHITSNRKIGDIFNYSMEHGIIYKDARGKYHYNGMKPLPDDGAQDLPFEKPKEDEEAPF